MIKELGNSQGISIGELKAFLSKYPDGFMVSIGGECNVGAYVDNVAGTILIDDMDYLEELLENNENNCIM